MYKTSVKPLETSVLKLLDSRIHVQNLWETRIVGFKRTHNPCGNKDIASESNTFSQKKHLSWCLNEKNIIEELSSNRCRVCGACLVLDTTLSVNGSPHSALTDPTSSQTKYNGTKVITVIR